jgi:hypothetical protein
VRTLPTPATDGGSLKGAEAPWSRSMPRYRKGITPTRSTGGWPLKQAMHPWLRATLHAGSSASSAGTGLSQQAHVPSHVHAWAKASGPWHALTNGAGIVTDTRAKHRATEKYSLPVLGQQDRRNVLHRYAGDAIAHMLAPFPCIRSPSPRPNSALSTKIVYGGEGASQGSRPLINAVRQYFRALAFEYTRCQKF